MSYIERDFSKINGFDNMFIVSYFRMLDRFVIFVVVIIYLIIRNASDLIILSSLIQVPDIIEFLVIYIFFLKKKDQTSFLF